VPDKIYTKQGIHHSVRKYQPDRDHIPKSFPRNRTWTLQGMTKIGGSELTAPNEMVIGGKNGRDIHDFKVVKIRVQAGVQALTF